MQIKDKYQLFYTEAIMPSSVIPSINRIKSIFENMSLDEFIELINKIMANNDHETFNIFLYYVMLFRKMKHMQSFINSDKFDIGMLEKLILFTHGYCTIHGYTLERVLDEILYFIDNKRLLELILYSRHISRDKLFLFYILSKFDSEMLDQYFKKLRDTSEFIDYFLKLPEEIMRSIIARNYKIFQYIMLLMAENEYGKIYTQTFFEKYKEDIEQFSKLSDIIRKYKKSINIEEEKKLPFNKRDMARISFIVNKIREMPNA
ncbi:MAG: hypothetical protein JXN64_03135, partial [Spirochaetes bacterium]|nr:hypothetical protein [Spirochaetota bacterium]